MGEVLLWQSYKVRPSRASVPRYLEDHAERLRAKYLAFVHDLGESKVDGKRIVEHLDLGDGFSFWWMTQLSEKSPFKSPYLYGCLRLMALEEILLEKRPAMLILDSADRTLAQATRRLCQNLGIGFSWRLAKGPRWKLSLHELYRCLPYAVRGLISLRHVVTQWPLRRVRRPDWFSGDNAIFLCSYFFNLDPVSAAVGRFNPRQWEGLPDLIQESGKHGNWIHHFLIGSGLPGITAALGWLRLFNQDTSRQGSHIFLQSYLSWRVLFRALGKWIQLGAVAWRLRRISHLFSPHGSAVWLWPYLRGDWWAHVNGPAAMSNCLWVELFDAALKDLPRQKLGLYLWENQGWETALLHAWRRHGHGKIVGVPHATVEFWHLNAFDDPRTLIPDRNCAKPLPDQLAVNGPMAWKAFVESGYPPARLRAVEALRFQYLATPDPSDSGKPGTPPSVPSPPPDPARKVLILGDYTFKQTLKMLRCIEAVTRLIDMKLRLTLKPHSVCPLKKEDYPTLSFELTDRPLAELVQEFDLAFSSNSTSAGLSVCLAGLPVIIFLDDGDFNHSPLRGNEKVHFAGTAGELADALRAASRTGVSPDPAEFFWLDPRAPRWRGLLQGMGSDRPAS